MAAVECRDVFNAVYTYVKGSYINSLYSFKIKSRTSNDNIDEDETLQKTKNAETSVENNVNKRDVKETNIETISESIDRMMEEDVADRIRMDLDEKFPFAIASVCSNLAVIDAEYRRYKGLEDQPEFSEYIIETSDDFPLCDRFVFPVIMYVSSMMLIDIDEKMSDEFYDKYATSVSKIISEIPYQQLRTVEKYPY